MHLSKTGLVVEMKPEDCIYSTCYKLHLSILKGIQDKTNSPDNALRDNIEFLRFKATVDRDTDELTRAVLKTVIFTAEQLYNSKQCFSLTFLGFSDPSYLPKWKKLEQEEGGTSTGTHCIYPNCLVNTKLIASAFEPTEKLETILSVKSNHENSFVLCQQHYQELYRKVHASNPCACCGTKPKFGQPFSRHSPDAETVSMHLSKTGLDVEMKPEDYICSTCYKLHLSILKGIHD